MLSAEEAIKIAQKEHPYGDIQAYIEYGNAYLFQIFNKLPGEEMFDPFFSVDMSTGEFKDISIIEDVPTQHVLSLFEEAKRR